MPPYAAQDGIPQTETSMIQRFDKIAADLPRPENPSANGAAALQELLGGKFGEMSTIMNYTFQSFNFRGRNEFRPFYDMVANIAAEEFGHIEVISYAINLMLTGTSTRGTNPDASPLAGQVDARNSYHFLATGQQALPVDSQGNFWTGQNVFSSGNLKLDMLHNFFLECGARANKMRVYEMVDDRCARAAVGYLLVRGGVHVVAYAKALEKLTGVDVGKLLPIPDLSNKKFKEAKKLEDEGSHLKLYRHSSTDYTRLAEIWNGPHPEDGQELVVVDALPPAYDTPDLDPEPQLTAPSGPDIDPQMFADTAKKLFGMKVGY